MSESIDESPLLDIGCIEGGPTSTVNISDVIEVIETDEMFGAASGTAAGVAPSASESTDGRRSKAYIKILEQPASKALRFRYECEGRSAGSIPGVNSSPENKTFPSIQIVGYHGRAVVVVSCVTKDNPFRPHPHNLVGKEGCSKGVCTLRMSSDTITFSNLGIQCVKKKDIEDALKVREEIRVDPFRTGFSHKVQPSSIDLNSVRLCFQVFLEGPKKDEFTIPLRPVVSDPIYDKKAMSDLTICKLSDCSATVAGGREIILLCEKVAKEDIQVRFYEERDGETFWESLGDFQPTHVHKQVAISFRTPKYKHIDVEKPVKVWVQLRRPSDGAVSESVPFQLVPLDSDPVALKRKRQKYGEGSPQNIFRSPHDEDSRSTYVGSVSPETGFHVLQVKREPADTSPNPYMFPAGSVSPMFPGASPGPPSPHNAPSPVPYPFNNYSTQFSLRHNAGGGLVELKPQETNPFNVTKTSPIPYGNIFPEPSGLNNLSTPSYYPSSNLASPNIVGASHNKTLVIGSTNMGTAGLTKPDGDARSHFANTMLDMDSQQYSLELSLGQLDSEELTRMATGMTDANLSENLSSHLTLSDVAADRDKTHRSNMDCDHNMTDSLTRVAIQELDTLSSMYPAIQP